VGVHLWSSRATILVLCGLEGWAVGHPRYLHALHIRMGKRHLDLLARVLNAPAQRLVSRSVVGKSCWAGVPADALHCHGALHPRPVLDPGRLYGAAEVAADPSQAAIAAISGLMPMMFMTRQIVGEHVQSGFVPLSALSRCNELSHAIWFRSSGGPSEFKPADRGADLVSAE